MENESVNSASRSSGDLNADQQKREENSGSLAGKMMGASAKSISDFAPIALQGMMVDIPLAMTEGMRTLPRHYGGSVRDHGAVVDAKSGFAVAGKNFAWGFIDGLSDVVVQPYKGARKEGALGAVKGLGKGVVSLTANSGSAMFGVLSYSSQGISKSLRTAVHTTTRNQITHERHVEGRWMLESGKAGSLDQDEVVSMFKRLRDVK